MAAIGLSALSWPARSQEVSRLRKLADAFVRAFEKLNPAAARNACRDTERKLEGHAVHGVFVTEQDYCAARKKIESNSAQ